MTISRERLRISTNAVDPVSSSSLGTIPQTSSEVIMHVQNLGNLYHDTSRTSPPNRCDLTSNAFLRRSFSDVSQALFLSMHPGGTCYILAGQNQARNPVDQQIPACHI
jgi:hypothetical protein